VARGFDTFKAVDALSPRDPVMSYIGRPGPSPVLASFFAAGLVQEQDRILDLGCGPGADTVALAQWGCRDVTGIDLDRAALGVARRRAAQVGVASRVRFVEADALALGERFGAASFDAIWDGLLLNNLRGDDEEAHARFVAHAARRGGLLLLEFRITKRAYDKGDTEAANDELRRWFDFGPPAATLIPERAERKGLLPFARVVVQVGERNGRRVR
jgi:SAM-dependent methyltransferase